MQALTFNQCVTNAWVDAWRIAKQNPLFLTSAVAAYYLMGIAFEATTGTVKHAPLGMLASLCASYSLKVLLLSVVAVQTQRFIVLEENRLSRPALFGAPYWRFVLLNFGVNAFPVAIVSVVAGSWNALHILTSVPSIGRGGRAVVTCAAGIAWFWAGTRLTLLSTHIAAGRPFRWHAGLRDTHGNSWIILGTYFVLAITLVFAVMLRLILSLVVKAIFGPASDRAVDELCSAIVALVSATVGAACSAWIYQRFARALVSPEVGKFS